jgi:hypothetical protein
VPVHVADAQSVTQAPALRGVTASSILYGGNLNHEVTKTRSSARSQTPHAHSIDFEPE